MSELYGNLLHQLAKKLWKLCEGEDASTPRRAFIYGFKSGYERGYAQSRKDFQKTKDKP